MSPPTEEEPIVEVKYLDMTGQFVFRFPSGYVQDSLGNEVVAFEEAKAAFNKERNVYELVRKDWRVGNIFQLIAKNVPKGKSVYVFSIDPKNKMELHWPLPSETDAFTRCELIPSVDAEIVMPNMEEGLRLAHRGEDNLVVLYSDYRIEDLEERMNKVHASQAGTFNEKLNEGFGDLMVDMEGVEYQLDEMSFVSHTEKGEDTGCVVPLVLSVVAN